MYTFNFYNGDSLVFSCPKISKISHSSSSGYRDVSVQEALNYNYPLSCIYRLQSDNCVFVISPNDYTSISVTKH